MESLAALRRMLQYCCSARENVLFGEDERHGDAKGTAACAAIHGVLDLEAAGCLRSLLRLFDTQMGHDLIRGRKGILSRAELFYNMPTTCIYILITLSRIEVETKKMSRRLQVKRMAQTGLTTSGSIALRMHLANKAPS